MNKTKYIQTPYAFAIKYSLLISILTQLFIPVFILILAIGTFLNIGLIYPLLVLQIIIILVGYVFYLKGVVYFSSWILGKRYSPIDTRKTIYSARISFTWLLPITFLVAAFFLVGILMSLSPFINMLAYSSLSYFLELGIVPCYAITIITVGLFMPRALEKCVIEGTGIAKVRIPILERKYIQIFLGILITLIAYIIFGLTINPLLRIMGTPLAVLIPLGLILVIIPAILLFSCKDRFRTFTVSYIVLTYLLFVLFEIRSLFF